MRTVADIDRWNAAIVQPSIKLATEVVLLRTDGSSEVLPVSDGNVVQDATAAVRGSADITVPGEDWVPHDATDDLAPYGNEIQPYRGIVYPDNTRELVSLGIYGIRTTSDVSSGSEVSTSLTCLDRSQRLIDAYIEDPLQIAAGTPIGEAILSVAQGGWSDVPYDSNLPTATALTLPKVVAAEGDDRWELIQGLASAIGMVVYFDSFGKLTLRTYSAAGVVASVTDGEGGVLIEVSRDWTQDDAFNKVIVTGENTSTSAVYRGVATDDDPNSPTRYGGPFGQKPRFWSSPYVGSNDAAQDAATSILAQELGTLASVSFQQVPNPALEPEDTVYVRREVAGVNENHILDSVAIELGPEGSMDCVTRQRTIVSV